MTAAAVDADNIVFHVVATEDLFLIGSCKSIRRVPKGNCGSHDQLCAYYLSGDRYLVQMQKTQTFRSLFRHYAKYHGLSKDELVYSFVNEIDNEDTPEGVHMMRSDEIYVRPKSEGTQETAVSNVHGSCALGDDLKSLLDNPEHSDVKLIVGTEKIEICAHRAILAARSSYFAAMLRGNASGMCMAESLSGVVSLPDHNVDSLKMVLEFLYTGKVAGMADLDCDKLLKLIVVADEFILPDLQALCLEHTVGIISIENICPIAKFAYNIELRSIGIFKQALQSFIVDNIEELTVNVEFKELVKDIPHLSLLLVESVIISNQQKKRRLS
jgi:speckle-type POZ protein